MALNPIPISFAPGSWGAIVNGQVANLNNARPFSLSARAGQFLTMIFDGGGPPDGKSGDPLGAQVSDPDGNLLDATNPHGESGLTVQLPKTGTYQIVIGLDNMETQWSGTFTLCVLVVNGERAV